MMHVIGPYRHARFQTFESITYLYAALPSRCLSPGAGFNLIEGILLELANGWNRWMGWQLLVGGEGYVY